MTTETQNIQFSPDQLALIEKWKKQYPEGKHKSALLRVLHLAQDTFGGYLSAETMDYVAEVLELKSIEVYEVATFYSMYNLKPVGKYLLEFCQTGPCYLRGVEPLIAYTEQKLGIKTNETTSDGMFTIKVVECLGACGYAPMMQVGMNYHENLTEAKIDQFIEDCYAGKISAGHWKF